MPLPTVYIVGVQKAGTTSLHNWLAQHPNIYAPLELKDVDYFANPTIALEAKERLLNDFSAHRGEKVILQSHVNYFLYPDAISRIKSVTPQAKLIVVLRNPVDRAISAFRYFKKMGQETREPEEALLYEPKSKLSYSQINNDLTYIEHGLYANQLRYVYKEFDTKQLLILNFEILKNKPEKLVKEVFEFLNIRGNFLPTFQRKNKTGRVRFKWLQKKLTSTNELRQTLIKYLFNWWLPSERRQYLRKQFIEMNTSGRKKKSVNPKTIRELQNIFEADQKELEELLKL